MAESDMIENPFEDEDLEDSDTIYQTYRMDYENKRIIGKTDGLEAVSQAIFKALSTRRFSYPIYDDQYGSDLYNKIGNMSLTQDYLESDIPAMVEDALANDDAVLDISELSYELLGGDGVRLEFSISTVFGEADLEGVVMDG